MSTVSTPFQLGALVRSVAVGLLAAVEFSNSSAAAAGGEAPVHLIIALLASGLVLYRLLDSAFYTRIPLSGWRHALILTHDILGTLVLFVFKVMLFVLRLVLSFMTDVPPPWANAKQQSALTKDGVVYKKGFWSGGWEPEQGFLGPKTDVGFFGNARIEQGWLGPKEKRELGNDGATLYERKS